MLFKYMSFNNNNKRIVISNLITSKLYFNTFLEYNDPFELYPVYDVQEDNMARFKEDFYKKYPRNILSGVDNEYINSVFRFSSRQKVSNSRYGITCFTRKNDNLLMWAHYADFHKGICLEFDIGENDDVNSFIDYRESGLYPIPMQGKFFAMDYVTENDRPHFYYGGSEEGKGYAPLYKKSKDWNYEEEIRLMVRTDELYKFPRTLVYFKDKLKSIICGCNMSLESFIELSDVAGRLKASLKASLLDEKIYKLEIVPISDEESLRLNKNFKQLVENFTVIEKFTIYNKFIRCMSRRDFYKYWSMAIRRIPLYLCLTELKCLSQLDLKREMGHGPEIMDKNVCKLISLFVFYMSEEIEYLKHEAK